MRRTLAKIAIAGVLLSSPALAGVSVQGGWFRALPSPQLPAGGYFTLHNGGAKPVTLTGAASPACGMLMLHKSEESGGMSSMADVARLDVPAGGDAKFAPGGYHLMCMNPTPAMKPGGSVPVTFSFADGAKATATFAVKNASGQ